jgi:hypothetical protein
VNKKKRKSEGAGGDDGHAGENGRVRVCFEFELGSYD